MGVFKSFYRLLTSALIVSFVGTSVHVPSAQAGEMTIPVMPAPGTMVNLSPAFIPAHLQGLTIDPKNALQFDFLIRRSASSLNDNQKRQEYGKLVKYFLASLTVADKDQWVNLSPYEAGRIIEDSFGKTDMGRDLLAQDYLLKQITSSLMYPESGLGKNFWDKVYERAFKETGNTDIPVNTFNKVWIVPDKADVYESGNTVYILNSHLKVMLEEDYLSRSKNTALNKAANNKQTHTVASKVIREVILPAIEKEVNEGKNFASLRQIYSAMILATWYKKALKESLLGKIYADKAKISGINQDPKANEVIYQQYIAAFKKGVYNYIKEEEDKHTGQIIPRKYFAGGFDRAQLAEVAELYSIDRLPKASTVGSLGNVGDIDRASVSLSEKPESLEIVWEGNQMHEDGWALIVGAYPELAKLKPNTRVRITVTTRERLNSRETTKATAEGMVSSITIGRPLRGRGSIKVLLSGTAISIPIIRSRQGFTADPKSTVMIGEAPAPSADARGTTILDGSVGRLIRAELSDRAKNFLIGKHMFDVNVLSLAETQFNTVGYIEPDLYREINAALSRHGLSLYMHKMHIFSIRSGRNEPLAIFDQTVAQVIGIELSADTQRFLNDIGFLGGYLDALVVNNERFFGGLKGAKAALKEITAALGKKNLHLGMTQAEMDKYIEDTRPSAEETALRGLFSSGPRGKFAVFELWETAQALDSHMSPYSITLLEEAGLMLNGAITQAARDKVLAMFSLKGHDLVLADGADAAMTVREFARVMGVISVIFMPSAEVKITAQQLSGNIIMVPAEPGTHDVTPDQGQDGEYVGGTGNQKILREMLQRDERDRQEGRPHFLRPGDKLESPNAPARSDKNEPHPLRPNDNLDNLPDNGIIKRITPQPPSDKISMASGDNDEAMASAVADVPVAASDEQRMKKILQAVGRTVKALDFPPAMIEVRQDRYSDGIPLPDNVKKFTFIFSEYRQVKKDVFSMDVVLSDGQIKKATILMGDGVTLSDQQKTEIMGGILLSLDNYYSEENNQHIGVFETPRVQRSAFIPDFFGPYGFSRENGGITTFSGPNENMYYRVQLTPEFWQALAEKSGSQKIRTETKDAAMKGGIDLNSANLNLQIKRDGKGVPLPLLQQDMAQLSNIQGFVPHIIEIRPAASLPILSELKQMFPNQPALLASAS